VGATAYSLTSIMLVFLVGARIYEKLARQATAMSIQWTSAGGAR
jgi:hypothetical protein